MEYKTLFFDIETVIKEPDYYKLSNNMKNIWEKKFLNRFSELEQNTLQNSNNVIKYEEKAGLFSLFNKIVCISFKSPGAKKVTSISGDDEKEIITKFFLIFNGNNYLINKLIGMNIFNFGIPQLRHKAMHYQIKMPDAIKNINSKTTWRTNHEDIMHQFAGSSNEWYSLPYICETLGVPTPKDNMDGSEVSKAYYKGKLPEIVEYCEKDVIATQLCYNKINY